MKRFVTYLYECERGRKVQNVGFIRVNVHGEETNMEICIRNLSRGNDAGKVYVLIGGDSLLGIELGEIVLENGQSNSHFLIQTNHILHKDVSIYQIEGICARLNGGTYIASCWKDDYADEIVSGEFTEEALAVAEESLSSYAESNEESNAELNAESDIEPMYEEVSEIVRDEGRTTYEKIELSQLRDLPSPNWHLSTNSFLLHGFWNYGYLVLKKVVAEDKEMLSLGVPGVFEKPEAVMAIYFGFPTFEEISLDAENADGSTSVELAKGKKNQQAETGAFGCWFVELKV